VVAPLLGGFIVDQLSWHWIFFINIPIGIITVLLIWAFLDDNFERKPFTMDWGGSLWLSVGLLALMLTFQLLGNGQLSLTWVVVGLVVTVLAFWLFLRQEKRTADPLIPLTLFKNRTFVIQNLIAALVSGFLMGFEVYLPTWTQGLLGLMASQAGFAITPSSLMWIVGSFIAGRLMLNHTPYQIVNISLSFHSGGGPTDGVRADDHAVLVLLRDCGHLWDRVWDHHYHHDCDRSESGAGGRCRGRHLV
jgi:Major Facilitator Superfamily.